VYGPDRRINANVPELDGAVPATGEEDVGVGRVTHAGKHAVVVPVHAVEVATT